MFLFWTEQTWEYLRVNRPDLKPNLHVVPLSYTIGKDSYLEIVRAMGPGCPSTDADHRFVSRPPLRKAVRKLKNLMDRRFSFSGPD